VEPTAFIVTTAQARRRPLGNARFLHGLSIAHEADQFARLAIVGLDGIFAHHIGGVFQRLHPPAKRLDRRIQLICNHGALLLAFASRSRIKVVECYSVPDLVSSWLARLRRGHSNAMQVSPSRIMVSRWLARGDRFSSRFSLERKVSIVAAAMT
jgi:hypothetical protein